MHRGALAEDQTVGSLSDFLRRYALSELEALTQLVYFIEGASVGDRDCRGIGKGAEPFEVPHHL